MITPFGRCFSSTPFSIIYADKQTPPLLFDIPQCFDPYIVLKDEQLDAPLFHSSTLLSSLQDDLIGCV
jgi:hypothetical protein